MMNIAQSTRFPFFTWYIAADLIQIIAEKYVFVLTVVLIGSVVPSFSALMLLVA